MEGRREYERVGGINAVLPPRDDAAWDLKLRDELSRTESGVLSELL